MVRLYFSAIVSNSFASTAEGNETRCEGGMVGMFGSWTVNERSVRPIYILPREEIRPKTILFSYSEYLTTFLLLAFDGQMPFQSTKILILKS